jgi:hypothetical protein
MPPHGFPPAPGWETPVPGRQEPGTPPAWRPDASNGNFSQSPGLGTDLFAIAGHEGQAGRMGNHGQAEQEASSQKNRIGLLVLMGVAALALVVIMILVVASFA